MMRCSSQQGLSPNPCMHVKLGDYIFYISMQTTPVSKVGSDTLFICCQIKFHLQWIWASKQSKQNQLRA